MHFTPDELKRLASIARIYKPHQLVAKAEFYIKTLMFQHDCLMVDCINVIDDDFEKYFYPMTALVRDRQQLQIILELLESIDTEYEQPSPEAVKSYLEECRSEMQKNSDRMSELREKFEKLFNQSPNADHL